MPSDLYRQAAIRARADKVFGVTLGLGAAEGRQLSIASVLFLLALSALATFAEYAKFESANGVLTTVQGELIQRAPRDGVVRTLQVAEGQLVELDELILKLDPNRTGIRLGEQEQELATLARRQYLAALDASSLLDEQQQLERRQLESQKNAALSQLRLLAQRRQFLNEQLEIQQAALSQIRALHVRKLSSANEVSERRLVVLQTKQSLAMLAAQAQEQKDRQRLLGLQVEAADLSGQHQLLESRTLEDQLGSSWLQARARADLSVVARTAGKVSAIEVKVGQQVKQGEPLFTVLPEGAAYMVQLDVNDRVIAHLSHGMPVRLRIDAYPWQKYGVLKGTVHQFASAPRSSLQATQAAWKVLVALDARPSGVDQLSLKLTAGLHVQADIELERQTLLRWMLGPLIETLKA